MACWRRPGAGSYFIRSAVALLGHFRGGPAKAAVVASAATGMISGSSITNVVTTGPLTIPLIKRVGYPAEKAAAIEVAASVNGQVMPPVMGAAAFLMVEYVGVPYIDVLKHALISAMVSYLGLLYIVHLEAVKGDLRGLAAAPGGRVAAQAGAVFAWVLWAWFRCWRWCPSWALWCTWLMPQRSFAVMAVVLLLAYVVLLWLSAPHAEPRSASADVPITSMPELGPTLRSGMHYLLPVGALVWNLVIEQMAPTRAAFWATAVPGLHRGHPAAAAGLVSRGGFTQGGRLARGAGSAGRAWPPAPATWSRWPSPRRPPASWWARSR